MSRLFDFGGNAAPLVALSCANGFTPQAYARALQPLTADYRVIAANMRPLWEPSAPESQPASLRNWRQLGDDLLATLATVTPPPTRVIGVGHSVGGVATVYAALKQPERFSHLILIDPTFLRPRLLWAIRLFRLAGQEHRFPLARAAMRRRRLWASTEDAFHHLSSRSLFKRWQPDVLRAFIDSAVTPTHNGTAPAMSEVTLRITPEWEARLFQTVAADVWRLPAQLRRLNIPTLVLRGEHTDVFTPVAERLFRQGYPDAQIETMPGAGHLIPQEQPDAIWQLMMTFLRQTPPR